MLAEIPVRIVTRVNYWSMRPHRAETLALLSALIFQVFKIFTFDIFSQNHSDFEHFLFHI